MPQKAAMISGLYAWYGVFNSICANVCIVYHLEAGELILRWFWGAVAQWSEHLQLKQEALGSIPGGYPGFFLFQLAY